MSGVAGQTYNFDSVTGSTPTTIEQSIAVQPYTELQFGGGDYYFYPLSYFTRLAGGLLRPTLTLLLLLLFLGILLVLFILFLLIFLFLLLIFLLLHLYMH